MMPFAPEATVADVLDSDAELTTFNNLIRRSGVIKEIDGPGPFTILAPTNAAFELLPPGALGALVDSPNRFHGVMQYHVLKGEYRGEAIREFDRLPTLSGDSVTVIVAGEGVVVGGAGLEDTDIEGTNGLVHKISNVMLTQQA